MILLVGEPGLGKTSLIGNFLQTARQRGAQTFIGHANEIERDFAYGPWIDALGRLPIITPLGTHDDDLDEKVLAETSVQSGRERLFAQVAQAIFELPDAS